MKKSIARSLFKFISVLLFTISFSKAKSQLEFDDCKIVFFAEETHYFINQINFKKKIFNEIVEAEKVGAICFENISFIETIQNYQEIHLHDTLYYSSLFIPKNKSHLFGIDIMFNKSELEQVKIFLEKKIHSMDSIVVNKIIKYYFYGIETKYLATEKEVLQLVKNQINDTDKQICLNIYFNFLNNSKKYTKKQKMINRDSIMYLNFIWIKEKLNPSQRIIVSASNFHLCNKNNYYVNLSNRIRKKYSKNSIYTVLMLSGKVTNTEIYPENKSLELFLSNNYFDSINYINPTKKMEKLKSRLIGFEYSKTKLTYINKLIFIRNDTFINHH